MQVQVTWPKFVTFLEGHVVDESKTEATWKAFFGKFCNVFLFVQEISHPTDFIIKLPN
jgi:hypothetical protein